MHGARLLYNSDSYVTFEWKKHIITCFSDNRLLSFTAIVTGTIFVHIWTKRFRYCSVVHWSKIYKHQSRKKIDIKIEIAIFFSKIASNRSKLKKAESWWHYFVINISQVESRETQAILRGCSGLRPMQLDIECCQSSICLLYTSPSPRD